MELKTDFCLQIGSNGTGKRLCCIMFNLDLKQILILVHFKRFINISTLLLLETEYSSIGGQYHACRCPTRKVARASAGIILCVTDRQHVLLLQNLFHLLASSQIQDTTENVATSLWSLKQFSMLRDNVPWNKSHNLVFKYGINYKSETYLDQLLLNGYTGLAFTPSAYVN